MTVQTAEARTTSAQAVLATAAAYQAEQAAETQRLVVAVLALWATLDAKQAWPSWTVGGIGARIFVLLSALMELVARDANGYVRQALADQDILYLGPDIDPIAFTGIASDGRDLESLLVGAVIKLRQAQRRGLSDAQGKMAGRNFLEVVVNTQVRDAARAAESVSLTVADGRNEAGRKVAIGYVRMLTPPSCGRCAVLAGKFYRWNTGFQRHPNCFPAGTVVSGPRMDAATRRWYQGELVTIRTASGQELSVTGNHPVLTRAGWLPARFLMPGAEVFRSTGAQSVLGQVPDDQQVPSMVEDVFGALGVAGDATQVPSAAEDFHGDGMVGEVDVVAADRHLGLEEQSEVVGVDGHPAFREGLESALLHAGAGGLVESLFAGTGSSNGFMGSGGLSQSLLGSHPAGAQETGARLVADLHALLQQARANGGATDLVLAAERVLTLASRVLRRQQYGVGVQDDPARWDAPAGAFSMETRAGYASRGLDLVERLTGQVAVDRVVEVVRRQWSGHVYNLTSSEGWMVAGGIVTSNCDCRHIPTTLAGSNEILTDPAAYFNSLSEEDQDFYFGVSQAQAIRDGADVAQVVNASRTKGSMFVADDGRRYTSEGTTKRGYARGVSGRVLRPTVWQIYRDAAGDREEARRLLQRFGYTLPAAP